MESVDPKYLDPLLGIVFDLDGTLVLSPHPFDKMRREVVRIAELHGVLPGHLSVSSTIAQLTEAAVSEIEHSGQPEGTRFRFEASVNRRLDELEVEGLEGTVVRPGAIELLQALSDKGYRIGLLTRSCQAFAHGALRRTGLAHFIRSSRTRSSPGPIKPDPEALLAVLRDLEVPPSRAVYVGDHRLDADCAHGARVRFYALLTVTPGPLGTETDRFKAAGAAAIARDLPELGRQLGVKIAVAAN
ncbi:MAG: HAD family hydrolase [Thermoplasmata archaeon]|nr:HAD family hydrolase [Thermoplasmata archaeon]